MTVRSWCVCMHGCLSVRQPRYMTRICIYCINIQWLVWAHFLLNKPLISQPDLLTQYHHHHIIIPLVRGRRGLRRRSCQNWSTVSQTDWLIADESALFIPACKTHWTPTNNQLLWMHVTSNNYYMWYNAILNTQPELQYSVGIYI